MSVTTVYESVAVTNREGHDASRDLDRSAGDKTLTSEELSLAIQLVSPRDGSVGISWIIKNQQHFIDCVPRDERLAFFAQHYDNLSIVSVATSFELLRFIPPQHRDELIREIGSRHIIPGWDWPANARYLGVSSEILAEQVLNRLNGTLLGPAATGLFVEHFLDKGAGRVYEPSEPYEDVVYCKTLDEHTLWSVFTDDTAFIEAMKLCARRVPARFFEQRVADELSLQDKLTVRLFRYQIAEILAVAAEELSSFAAIPEWALDDLPEEAKLVLARRALPGSLTYMVRLILASFFAATQVVNFSEELDFVTLRNSAVPAKREDVLRTFQELYQELTYAINCEIEVAQEIYDWLTKLLAKNGYVIGTVETDSYNGRKQCFVQYNHRNDNPNGFSVKYVLLGSELRPSAGASAIIDVHAPVNRHIHAGGKIVLTKFISMSGGDIIT